MNMSADSEHDVIIIGAGPGGYVAALHASRLGGRPLLIEKERIGGTCLNKGCIPTKSLLARAGLFQEVKEAKDYGVSVDDPGVDFSVMMQRKDKIVSQLVGGLGMLFKSWSVDVLEGNAKFVDSHTVEVAGKDGTKSISCSKIIIATGSMPSNVPGVKIDGENVINSDHALQLKEVPSSILIVGGGVIGVEFASIFNMLGTKVTIVEMLPNIIPFEDEEVSKALKKSLEKTGIVIKTETRIESVTGEGGKQKAVVAGQGGSEEIVADKVLVAVGRSPYTEGLEMEKAGIKIDKGRVTVNDKMETNVEGIYAIGDVIGGTLLAHVASEEGMVAVDNALGRESTIDYSLITGCIYCLPQVASVGMTESKARESGVEYSVGKFPFTASAKGLVLGKREGFIKVIAEKKTKKILGVHIIGHDATELIAESVIALKMGATTEAFTRISHAHPSLHESMLTAMDDVNDEAIELARKKK